jgi:hypothetical protein
MKTFIKTKHFVLLIGILFILLNVLFSLLFKINYKGYIWSDAQGYYQYLPYLFIKNDLAHQFYATFLGNGMTINKYTYGVALLEMPFFLSAHIYSLVMGLPHNGYTVVYGFILLISVSFYVFIGLRLLYKILLPKFGRIPTIIALIAIYFATNLFYYTVVEPGMSHAYSFLVLSWFLYRLDFFMKAPDFKNTVLCGLPLALSVLIRPTNIVYSMLFLMYDVHSYNLLKERFFFIFKNIKFFLLLILMGILIFIPQIYYWSFVTKRLILYGYINSAGEPETFKYIVVPKIREVLFGVESGWLIYSPIFLFFVIGLVITLIKKKYHAFGILIVFVIILYLNASWWAYTFSCSFGYRSFIEYYPLFIIPIACFFSTMYLPQKKYFQKAMVGFFIVIFAFTNIRMSQLYYKECCWVRPDWTWVSYNRLLNKVFYIIPQNTKLK